jgi:hypothetical protein
MFTKVNNYITGSDTLFLGHKLPTKCGTFLYTFVYKLGLFQKYHRGKYLFPNYNLSMERKISSSIEYIILKC